MKITGLDHITINIKDVEKTNFFYGELLGLKELPSIDMGDHLLRYFAIPGGTRLELIQYRYPTRNLEYEATDKGIARHFAFVVKDVKALEKQLTKAGYPFCSPVTFNEKLGFAGGLVKDPNGFELEFLEYPPKTEKK